MEATFRSGGVPAGGACAAGGGFVLAQPVAPGACAGNGQGQVLSKRCRHDPAVDYS